MTVARPWDSSRLSGREDGAVGEDVFEFMLGANGSAEAVEVDWASAAMRSLSTVGST